MTMETTISNGISKAKLQPHRKENICKETFHPHQFFKHKGQQRQGSICGSLFPNFPRGQTTSGSGRKEPFDTRPSSIAAFLGVVGPFAWPKNDERLIFW